MQADCPKVYPQIVLRICQQCHAKTADESRDRCPACGGNLVTSPGADLDPPGLPPSEADHRGILLPRRHPVGGVITPR